jgi:hypothetical protein
MRLAAGHPAGVPLAPEASLKGSHMATTTSVQGEEQPGGPEVESGGWPRSGLIPVLTILFGVGLAFYLAVEPTLAWILLVVMGLVALGTDGVIRSHPQADFHDVSDTAPYLFVPTLLALSAGLFLEDTVVGYWTLVATVVAAIGMGATVYAEYVSVDVESPAYPAARFILNVATYLTAFGIYAAVYSFDVALIPAALAVGATSVLLAAEVLREGEPDLARTVALAGAIGLVIAEARWALYFLPLEGFLAAVFLLLVFYLSTGLTHHSVTGNLSRSVALEFVTVALAGLAVVIIGRIAAGA